jgi:glycerol-1-phosphate dehydrogenase [NAD(P)+]
LVDEDIFSRICGLMKDREPDLEKKKALLVTDGNLQKLYGSTVSEICGNFGMYEIYLVENGSFEQAVALAKHIVMNDIEVVIGFGGGSVLDMAKYASFVSKALYICLPTTLSNDSLVSPVAVLGTDGTKRKTFKCTIPDAILVDVGVIMSAPEIQLLAGIGDTISKYTALKDWKIDAAATGKPIDDFAYMISKMAFNAICFNEEKSLKSKSFIKILAQALVMGGLAMEIAGNSRPSSGSEHLFCHSLEENFPEIRIPHGISVAMGTVVSTSLHNANIAKIKRILHQYNLPVRPGQWKITEDIFIETWQKARASRADRHSILDTADLSSENLSRLYREMEEEFK